MPNLHTTLTLRDNVSGSASRIIKHLSTTERVMRSIDKSANIMATAMGSSSSRAISSVEKIADEAIKLSDTVKASVGDVNKDLGSIDTDIAQKEVRKLKSELNSLGKELDNINKISGMSTVGAAIGGNSKISTAAMGAAGAAVGGGAGAAAGIAASLSQKLKNGVDKVTKDFASKWSNGIKLFDIKNIAAALYTGQELYDQMIKIGQMADKGIMIEFRLSNMDSTGATGAQLYDYAYMAANSARTDADALMDSANRILQSGAVGGNGQKAIDLAETIAKSGALSGASSEEQSRALRQLSQGLSSGVLQGDELRAIREQTPGIAKALADGLSSLAEEGVLPDDFLGTTMGDLKELGAQGKLTSDVIVAAFDRMADDIDAQFANVPRTFSQGADIMSNVMSRFFKILGQDGNGLDVLNQKFQRFVTMLSDPNNAAGMAIIDGLGNAFNGFLGAISGGLDMLYGLTNWMATTSSGALMLQSILGTLAVMAVIAGVAMFAAFVSAYYPIILTVAAVFLLVNAFLSVGFTVGQIVGGVVSFFVTGFLMIFQLVAPILISIVSIIANILTVVYTVVSTVWTIVSPLIKWLYDVFVSIFAVIDAVFTGAATIVGSFITSAVSLFGTLADKVLGVLEKIASALDAIFGSGLADTVAGWRNSLDTKIDDLVEKQTATVSANLELQDNLNDTLWDIKNMDAEAIGDEIGKKVEGMFSGEGFDFDINGLDIGLPGGGGGGGVPLDIPAGGIPVTGGGSGGNLGNVGINDSVDISDEDVKMIRSLAARDYIINLQTVTPIAKVTFGDVRETADVKKIWHAIQDMVDAEMDSVLTVV